MSGEKVEREQEESQSYRTVCESVEGQLRD